MNNKFKNAFTLAEVLVTLVVIGVVAALTVRVLFSTTDTQERVARVKKTYSMFSQAMTHVKARGGDIWRYSITTT